MKQANNAPLPEGEAGQRLPLGEHLRALRRVLIVCLAAVGIGFLVSYYLVVDWLLEQITAPIAARGIRVIYTAVGEALTTKLRVALVTGVILAFPVMVREAWVFVRPALYPGERRSFALFFFAALVLFLTGIVFCYAGVFYLAVDFFLVSGQGLAEPMLSIDKYIGFLFGFLLPFGLAFLLPAVLYITTRMGLTNARMLAHQRKFVILAVFVLAAVLTPPDVVSQVLLALPLLLLYEVSILVCRTVRPKEAES